MINSLRPRKSRKKNQSAFLHLTVSWIMFPSLQRQARKDVDYCLHILQLGENSNLFGCFMLLKEFLLLFVFVFSEVLGRWIISLRILFLFSETDITSLFGFYSLVPSVLFDFVLSFAWKTVTLYFKSVFSFTVYTFCQHCAARPNFRMSSFCVGFVF